MELVVIGAAEPPGEMLIHRYLLFVILSSLSSRH